MTSARPILIWTALAAATAVPIGAAAASPLLAWRAPIYIAAGFAATQTTSNCELRVSRGAGVFLPDAAARWWIFCGVAYA